MGTVGGNTCGATGWPRNPGMLAGSGWAPRTWCWRVVPGSSCPWNFPWGLCLLHLPKPVSPHQLAALLTPTFPSSVALAHRPFPLVTAPLAPVQLCDISSFVISVSKWLILVMFPSSDSRETWSGPAPGPRMLVPGRPVDYLPCLSPDPFGWQGLVARGQRCGGVGAEWGWELPCGAVGVEGQARVGYIVFSRMLRTTLKSGTTPSLEAKFGLWCRHWI